MIVSFFKYFSSLRLLFVFIFVFSFTNSNNAQEPLILGIHPYLPHTELQKRFTPLVEYLSREIGQKVIVRIGISYEEHINSIGVDKIDIAYMGPASYVKLVEDYGEKSLVAIIETNGTPYYQGKIFTGINSSIESISEIDIEKCAFVDPNSTAGYLIPMYLLLLENNKDITPESIKFLGSHNNVALGVLTGGFVAGAIKEAVFYDFQKKGLRKLASTPKIPEHSFVASSKLPEETINKIKKALLKLNEIDEGKQIMASLQKNITGMATVNDVYFNELREIITYLEKREIIR
ncbi:MAG: phosphate/phosphite/phosphonate ABC transporter substrate-binding protein [Bacteroidales bacterium]|nr:phosphate/phosphite/phosphonate ABC transporter substrate-binding protein [Bacteroidales bacterium]